MSIYDITNYEQYLDKFIYRANAQKSKVLIIDNKCCMFINPIKSRSKILINKLGLQFKCSDTYSIRDVNEILIIIKR